MRKVLLSAIVTLSACAPISPAQVSMNRSNTAIAGVPMTAMQSFASLPAPPPERSNKDIARDIIDLQFRMESGRPIPVLSRFDGPITIALAGDVPPTAPPELAKVMARFRNEAGLDVHLAPKGTRASVTIEFLPKATLRKVVPSAACFVVPRVSSWSEYIARRNTPTVDWATMVRRDHVSIFAPSDGTPQEVRDCLHEETAQSMGPLNDMYRLADSVFNDDNFNTVLTGFDMLVLRAHYAPELRTGMSEPEVAARLPAILARLNPVGETIASGPPQTMSPRSWIAATMAAFSLPAGTAMQRAATDKMLSIAQAQGWQDNRLALSYFATGRSLINQDMPAAITAFRQADKIYRTLPGGQLHAAHIDMQLAAFALAARQYGEALALTERAIPVVRQGENASLLATLLMLRAEALDAVGRKEDARAARLDSLGWARYGFGSQAEVKARMADIAALANRGHRS
jgi:hypothetical protein